MKIKVGYLLSYDYKMFLTSVKQLYDYVDKIVVGIDKDYLTWSGNRFFIGEKFFEEVKKFDTRNIIEFYFEKFYISELSPMECESRERNMVLKKLGSGWKIQLDVDEYIHDFKSVKKYLNKYSFLTYFPKLTPICFSGKWVTLFKMNEQGAFFIDNNEYFTFITNQSYNQYTRTNLEIFNSETDIKVIHQSWARSDEEIVEKIANWGHKNDFDTLEFFNKWKQINDHNYFNFKNFHPLAPAVWNKLYFQKANSVNEFISNFESLNKQKMKNIDLILLFKNVIHRLIIKK